MGVLRRQGVEPTVVLQELDALAADDVDWADGRLMSGIYDPGETAHDLAAEAYRRFLAPNALYINLYPSAAAMEKDILDSVIELLRGDEQVAGSLTTGGTESIMLAVKAARDHARAHRPEITRPSIVLPVTAHPAFQKAAHYLGLEVIMTPVDTTGFRADPEAFAAALTPDTILGVGSAPNFSHGTIDPIEAMAAVASEQGVLFHVDACVGGIYLSVLRRMGGMGREVPAFDFSVPGVTSISTDLHKYGYAPKNASLVMYRDRELRRHAMFVCSATTEYAVINPTVLSSRSAGPVAAAWAVMRHLGEEGYERIVGETHQATGRVLAAIADIDGIEVLADPEIAMFTLASEEVNVFELDDAMKARGWTLLPQFACGGGPANLHVSVTWTNLPHMERFVEDLAEAVEELRDAGPAVDRQAMATAVAELEGAPLDHKMISLAGLAGITGDGVPEKMAALNTILDLLDPAERDQILATFVNLMS